MKRTLTELRAQVDQIDEDILRLLRERFAVTEKIIQLKQDYGFEVRDPDRERKIIEKVGQCAEAKPEEQLVFMQIFRKILDLSRKRYERLPKHLEWHDELTPEEVVSYHHYQMRTMTVGPVLLSKPEDNVPSAADDRNEN